MTYTRGEGGEYPTLPSGTYAGKLVDVEETTQPDYHDKTKEVPAVRFKFLCAGPTGEVNVVQSCSSSVAPTSNLHKFLTGMSPQEFPSVIAEDKKITGLLNSLVGDQYLITTELKTSAVGREYNKITNIALPPKGFEAPKQEGEEVSYEDDEIPF